MRRAAIAAVVVTLVAAACSISLLQGASLISPEQGAVLACESPDFGTVRFAWSRYGEGTYTLTVYSSAGNPVASRVLTETRAEMVLECGFSFQWDVAAVSQAGGVVRSERRSFSILPGNGESVVQLLSPADGAVLECAGSTAGVVQFSWGAVQGASSYVLEVYRDDTRALVGSVTVAGTSAQMDLPCGAPYRWRVAAQVSGARLWSTTRTFQLSGETLHLISPPDGSSVSVGLAGCNGVNRVGFAWNSVRNAARYTVEVYRAGTLVASVSTQETSAQLAWQASSCGEYSWRVVAARTNSTPPAVSATWRFTTVP